MLRARSASAATNASDSASARASLRSAAMPSRRSKTSRTATAPASSRCRRRPEFFLLGRVSKA